MIYLEKRGNSLFGIVSELFSKCVSKGLSASLHSFEYLLIGIPQHMDDHGAGFYKKSVSMVRHAVSGM